MRTYFIETALDSKFLAQLSFGSSISKWGFYNNIIHFEDEYMKFFNNYSHSIKPFNRLLELCFAILLRSGLKHKKTRKQKITEHTRKERLHWSWAPHNLFAMDKFIFLNIFFHVNWFPLKIIHRTWNLIKYWCNFWGHLSFCKIVNINGIPVPLEVCSWDLNDVCIFQSEGARSLMHSHFLEKPPFE